MLIRESYNSYDVFNLLQNQTYLTEQESCLNIDHIPIIQRGNSNTIHYNYIHTLEEETHLNIDEILLAIQEEYGLDSLYMQVPDYILIESPELREYDIYIEPLNSQDTIYRLCDLLTEAYLETEDNTYLNALLEDEDSSSPPETSATRQTVDGIKTVAGKVASTAKTLGSAAKSIGTGIVNYERDLWNLSANPIIAAKKKYDDTHGPLSDERGQFKAVKTFATHPTTLGILGGGMLAKKLYTKIKNRKKGIKNNDGPTKEEQKIISDIVNKNSTEQNLDFLKDAAKFDIDKDGTKIIKTAEHAPRTWIAKKISALRAKYYKWMILAKRNPNPGIKVKLKKACAMLLSIIDKLLALLQRATDSSPKKEGK